MTPAMTKLRKMMQIRRQRHTGAQRAISITPAASVSLE
jgi:hypothetical protein